MLIFPFASHAMQDGENNRTILWRGIEKQSLTFLYFDGAIRDISYGSLPVYFERFPVNDPNIHYTFKLEELVFENLGEDELVVLDTDINFITAEININSWKIVDRKLDYYTLSFVPIRKNPLTDHYEKLVSFRIIIQKEIINGYQWLDDKTYKEHSVLSVGKWYKLALKKSGIYRINKTDLANMGIDPSSVDPKKIRIFGNGGKMLPEKNSDFRFDDLIENAIFVKGEDDGVFDNNDFILFYGESPDIWEYDTLAELFFHIKNLYSDYTYYFLNINSDFGKRMQTESSSSLPQTHNISKFNDHQFYEKDENNLIGSGKVWYGEVFSNVTTYEFPVFSFPDIDISSNLTIKVDLAARSFINSTFSINATGMPSPLIATIYPVSQSQNTDYAKTKQAQQTYFPSYPDILVSITYNKSTLSGSGWLNYIELNAMRHLIFSSDQMQFRNTACIGQGNISEFVLSNASASVKIWDISNPVDVKIIDAIPDNNEMTFRIATDSLKEFIAFNDNTFFDVEFIGEVENQDLHAIEPPELIIVTHPDFLNEAIRLAGIHLLYDNYSSCIVTPEQIYNEFSSGKQDVTAIRDFVKMLYDRSSKGSEPEYLLLFGDGSYDNKNKLNTNNNFIPTYQSNNSLLSTATFVSDDYFGLLDSGEGNNANGTVDIGIGRLTVQTREQAGSMVDKIEHYISPAATDISIPGEIAKFGDWRNEICFVADDEDGNLHFNQAEHLAKFIEKTYKTYNIDKIYLDAYPQVATPGGNRYPEVNKAINERIAKGSLLVNYFGHGGEGGWAYENVLEISDIVKWDNYSSLPAFLTATCEFSRFDDPLNTTAGEWVVLNPNGGGIAIFSTTRVAFASSNFSLTVCLYDHIFEKINNKYPRLGDLIRLSKNDNNNDATLKNFILLGDPALKLNYPRYSVITEKINNKPVSGDEDTLSAYEQITVSGFIADQNENKISDFNGVINPVIYDKASQISTLGNDNNGSSAVFQLQNNILYKGRASIKNGEFSFSFVMPKDIDFSYGNGKISYYAEDGQTDASGFYNEIIVGGSDNNSETDFSGPEINLYINDTNFVTGGRTNSDPVLLAHLFDENGINAFGNGIGHEITAVLDENNENTIVLNQYYQAALDSYQSGNVAYQFFNLNEGMHEIKLKAWDMFNNSSVAYINFFVSSSNKLELNYVMNYPNPFLDETYFFFDHNQAGKELDIGFQIYAVSGQQVLSRNFRIIPEDYNTEFFTWDGRNDNGNILSKGVYVYRIIVKSKEGYGKAVSQKLVILK